MKSISISRYYILLSVLLVGLTALLFRESFMGLVLQGVDDNISMRQVLLRSLLSHQGYHFIPNYWLGFIFNIPNPDFYNTILQFTGKTQVVFVYVLALLLSGFIVFNLLRRLDISPMSSIFGSLSYTFLPHVLSLVYSGHALALEAIPMTPGLLLCISVILDGKTKSSLLRVLAAVWGGIFFAWMMIGEPQRGIYGSVLAVAWVVFLLFNTNTISFKERKFFTLQLFKKKLSLLVLTAVVGISIFASTLVFWSNSEFLSNPGSWEFATSWSFPPSELLDTFAFGFHGLITSDPEVPYYGQKPLAGNTDSLGFFMLLLTVLSAVLMLRLKNSTYKFFFIAGLLALLLSFGKYFPGTPFFWLWYSIPGMSKLRVPAKFLSITGLCWSVVAAMGLDFVKTSFQNNDKKITKIVCVFLTAAAAVSIIWLISLIVSGGGDAAPIRKVLGRSDRKIIDAALSGRVNSVLVMAFSFAVSAAVCIGMYMKPKMSRFLPSLVILFTIFNLYSSNRIFIAKTYVDEKEYYPRTALIQFLEQNLSPLYRASGSLFIPNLTGSPAPMGFVIEQALYAENNYDLTYAFPYFDINMFGRIPISRIDDGYYQFFKSAYDSVPVYQSYSDIWELNKRVWFAGNVKYLIVGKEIEENFQNELARDTVYVTNLQTRFGNTVKIFELNNVLPRFAIFNNVKSTVDYELFQEFTFALQNMDQFVLPVEQSGIEINPALLPKPPLEAEVIRKNYNAYEIKLGFEEDKVLYFGDLFDKGWKAELDGEQVGIHRANGIQQYVYIPKNTQQLTLFYDRPVAGFWYSRILIAAAIAAAVGFFIYVQVLKRKSLNK
ncbi:MAG: hypothetical protein ACRCTQ_02690 [Brevinemataceae bacterium]